MCCREDALCCRGAQILDGYLIKYGATLVALLVYAAPMYARGGTRQDQGDVTQDYIRAMRLLQNTSRCVMPTLADACACHRSSI